MKSDEVSATRFYTDVLGAELRNPRWSWGAYDSVRSRVYLRVWEDEVRSVDGARYAMVLRAVVQTSPGRLERERHLALASAGTAAYGVLCTPDGPRRSDGPRRIANFNRERLLRLGRIIDLPEGRYA